MSKKSLDNSITDDLNDLRIQNEEILQFLNSKRTGGDFVGYDNIPIPSMSLTNTDKETILNKIKSFGTIVQKIGNDIRKRYGNELDSHIQNLVNTQTIALQTIIAIQDGRIHEFDQGRIIFAINNFQNSILQIRGHVITLDSHDPTGKGFRKLQKKERSGSSYTLSRKSKIIIGIILGVLGVGGVTYEIHINNFVSTNQSGGIAANIVNIGPNSTVNLGSSHRHMNADYISALNAILPKDRTKTISITSVLGDEETLIFANEIKNYLESNGWKVDGVNQAVFTAPLIGLHYSFDSNGNMILQIGSRAQ